MVSSRSPVIRLSILWSDHLGDVIIVDGQLIPAYASLQDGIVT